MKSTKRVIGMKGFTLIELLVVVAIIAVLVALLLPALSRARNHARNIVCVSNVRNIELAHMNYSNDFNDRLVVPWFTDIKGGHAWWYDLRPYWNISPDSKEPAEVLLCPSDSTGGGFKSKGAGPAFIEMTGSETGARSYGASGLMWQLVRRDKVPQPDMLITSGDSDWWLIWPYGTNALDPQPTYWSAISTNRHDGGKINVSFLDGHVGSVRAIDIYQGGDKYNLWFGGR